MQYHRYAHKPAVEMLGTATSWSLLCPPWYFSLLLIQEQLIPSCESLWICKYKEIVPLCACVFNPFEHASFFQISSSHFFLCVPPERKMRKKNKREHVFATWLVVLPMSMTRRVHCTLLAIPVQPFLLP